MSDMSMRAVFLMALTTSASSSFVVPGPTTVVLLGVAVPALSAIFGMVGVLLGHLLAPAAVAALGWRRRLALVLSLLGIVTGIVIATGQQPLVAMSWGIGLGFSGMTITSTLGSQAAAGFRTITGAVLALLAARFGVVTPPSDSKESGQ